ncbi:MAG TPA: DNA recombination protein RmuC [Acetobacteraceae bacterium]|nr:DNA recombination protein RmuC [Acetobacteraceae bacterium]
MTIETALPALALLTGLVTLAVLLFRAPRAAADAAAAAALQRLQDQADRQAERLAALPGEVRGEIVARTGEIGDRLNTAVLDQTKALGEAMARVADRLAEQERAVLDRLARDAAALVDRLALDAQATRDAIAEQRAQVVKALADHKEDTGLLRRDVTQGVAEIRLAFSEGLARLQETLTVENTRARDLLDAKLRELRESNEQRLREIQKTVDEQLQTAVEKQMKESFARVTDKFDEVQKAMTDVQAVTSQIGDIKRIFTNVKTRGGWAEAQVKALLDDILSPGSYETNFRVGEASMEAVEFAIAMPVKGGERCYLAVDAKFPTEDYERLITCAECGDTEGEGRARNALRQRIREEAAKIASKYIRPPRTVEFAVLYLPTEGLYAEVARVEGLLEELSRSHRVLVLGPSLLPAMLRTIQLGYVTLSLGQKADIVREMLGATKAEMQKWDEVLGRLSKQVGTVGKTIEAAQVRTRAVARRLRTVEAVPLDRVDELLGIEEDSPVVAVEDVEEVER